MKTTTAIRRSVIYRNLYPELKAIFGAEEAGCIWRYAEHIHQHLHAKYDAADPYHCGRYVFPAAAIYLALKKRHPDYDALGLLRSFGTKTGERMRKLIHAATSLPFVPCLIRRNLSRIMHHASSAELGYTRRIVYDTNDRAEVDILSCPLYDLAKKIGVPEACRTICAMDKVYMTGFRQIGYRRTKSVAEGDDCCDYRLWWDKQKK